MDRVRKAQEEKEQRECKKKEKAEERKRKREEKERRAKEKNTKGGTCKPRHKRTNKSLTPSTSQSGHCPVCDAPYDEDDELWLQCENCEVWCRKDCAGYGDWTEEDLMSELYMCDKCQDL